MLEVLGISKYTREKGVTWRTHCGCSGNSLVPSDLETLKSSVSSQEKGGCKKRAEALMESKALEACLPSHPQCPEQFLAHGGSQGCLSKENV